MVTAFYARGLNSTHAWSTCGLCYGVLAHAGMGQQSVRKIVMQLECYTLALADFARGRTNGVSPGTWRKLNNTCICRVLPGPVFTTARTVSRRYYLHISWSAVLWAGVANDGAQNRTSRFKYIRCDE